MKLSVVVITRNQEWNIARLIQSVLDETRALDMDAEIVLVDSASTDGTISIATEFPIAAYCLSPNQRLTAAAGRFVGTLNTTGEYVQFLDGDMELIAGWLRSAINVLDTDPSIAAVGGRIVDLPMDTPVESHGDEPVPEAATSPYDVGHAGGSAMYRRSVLDEVGTFNPFIYSDEEPELCIRIRYRGGYRVVRLDRPVVYHYSDPDDRYRTVIRRARRNLYVGAGQNLRSFLGTDLFVPYARERGFGLVPGIWLVAGGGSVVVSSLTGSRAWIGAWALVTAGGLVADVARKRSVNRSLHSLLKRSVILTGTVRGFLMKPRASEDYPTRLVSLS